jgi:hypothetical protein
LRRADRYGLPVHPGTSAAYNVRFYQRLDLTMIGIVDLHCGGPRTWLMKREPGHVPAAP